MAYEFLLSSSYTIPLETYSTVEGKQETHNLNAFFPPQTNLKKKEDDGKKPPPNKKEAFLKLAKEEQFLVLI